MRKPVLYGADYSVYVRIARLALLEKGVEHELAALDIFAEGGAPEWYRELHPFGRIPAFEHDGFHLFETSAITRYVDEAFAGPALQPEEPRRRAVMNQIIGLLDAYAYRAMVWDIYVETVSKSKSGSEVDQARVDAAIPIAEKSLATLARLGHGGRWLVGDELSLADLHAAPIFAYFAKAPIAAPMLDRYGELRAWWERIQAQPSFASTEPTS
ncbi:glutathione S-transferase family protein [Arvimicrobium flavum]|uniref:glutathione S-transferase family protein n=1 Tax=Arvimicrobium flavum TaxID=3393320 RepID=UPI00237B3885|nr:glutathione S-transferase family protein [Mesorhizobium shangrilense]